MGVSQRQAQDQRVSEKPGQKSTIYSSSFLLYAGIAAVLAGYAAWPSKSNPLYSAIFLSYPLPPKFDSGPTQYGKGPKDLIFVAFYTLVLFAARDFVREYLARAIANSWGVTDKAKQTKFIQQLWQAIYFGFIAVFGLCVMKRTPVWFFHMPGLFDGFPHETHDAPFKVFYLVHSANWVQQALVTFLVLEKARKDNVVMSTHHVIALSAIPLIYKAHMTHFALALIIPHDISDSLLAFGKCISYADPSSTIAVPYFALFVCSWIYFRHFIGSITFWTLLTKYKPAITHAYHWENEQWKAATLHGVVVALFGALQLLNIYWLYLILRIAAKAVSGEKPKDERESDEEEEDEKED
ncbi:MAG: hypothetical protein M1827_007573 [Pycnora praestabilis]|nr:MAG: hypothetical protein M1827_007573 [Pycnora praestabilis]